MCTDSILIKIKKALELAERAGTEGEAQAAFNKAQELMIKYSVTEEDLPQEETKIVSLPIVVSKRMSTVDQMLVVTLVKHFPVEGVISYQKLSVVGRKADTDNFKMFYETVRKKYESLRWKAWYKFCKTPEGIRPDHITSRTWGFNFSHSYVNGFCFGLNQAFEINEVEKGLIVVSPAAVLDHVAETTHGKSRNIRATDNNTGSSYGVEDGMTVGRGVKSERS